jgi:hypothetical protein
MEAADPKEDNDLASAESGDPRHSQQPRRNQAGEPPDFHPKSEKPS